MNRMAESVTSTDAIVHGAHDKVKQSTSTIDK